MDRHFGGLIWTNHAMNRLLERGIKQGDAWATWKSPDQSRYARRKDAWVYHRTISDQRIEVVAQRNEKKEWVVLSVWSRPVHTAKISTSSGTSWKEILRNLFRK